MTRKITQLAILSAAGSILFIVESVVPNPFPWMRLGLANVISLLALKWWGMRDALIILVLRVLLGSLFSGRFMHPLFMISLTGGVMSVICMAGAMNLSPRVFSLSGVSIIGAFSKNVTQLLLAYLIWIRQINVFFMLPWILITALGAGLIIGVLAVMLDQRLHTFAT